MLTFLFLLLAVILLVLDALGVNPNRRLMSWGLASMALAFLISNAGAVERFM